MTVTLLPVLVQCLDLRPVLSDVNVMLYSLFCSIPIYSFAINHLTVHLDCQSLINKLWLHQPREYFTPYEVISSERDVLLQIEYFLDLLAISFNFECIKGHQDDKKHPSELDSPALSNICTDSCATSSLESANPSPSVSFFPASQCQLLSPETLPITFAMPFTTCQWGTSLLALDLGPSLATSTGITMPFFATATIVDPYFG